ncbi:hypothetical protein GGX14DRAFT_567455 [Mycena pura]|uniref:DUF6534 domain-containing protein n=1 Tax=Mycena pura TaxID=153505 RepID=A0AAD6YBJ3_9AGAR|nr:hypothetical protein GGX14DRAFT_567455 [Mycena pura]
MSLYKDTFWRTWYSFLLLGTMAQDLKDMRSTIGATIAGCMVSVGLSAVVGFQTFLYFQIFPTDSLRYKLLVGWVWLFDAAHTILICTSIWQYAVNNFNNPDFVVDIVPTLAVHISFLQHLRVLRGYLLQIAVAMTAITTLTVNVFYGWRIHKMSNGNWVLTSLISALLVVRTGMKSAYESDVDLANRFHLQGLAFVTTVEMILTKTFSNFNDNFIHVLTAGLSTSAATDIVISLARYYYLRNLQRGYPGTQEMVDAVLVFTINDGCLTCGVVIAAIACLLHMPTNFVWLGIYFSIAKLYSNSVLATLNLRNWYRHRQRPVGIPLTHQRPQAFRNAVAISTGTGRTSTDKTRKSPVPSGTKELEGMPSKMEVFVDRQVEYNVGELEDSEDTRSAI